MGKIDYNRYNAWRKSIAPDDTDYTTSDANAKRFLSMMAEDEVAKKMLGLNMLSSGIIDRNTMNYLMMKNIINYM